MSNGDLNINVSEIFPAEAFREMVEAGVFYGRKKTKTHPKMRPFVLMTRNNIEIIDLTKTLEFLGKAFQFLREKVKEGGLILFVATQPQAADDVRKVAEEFKFPYVTGRWLGGTLTNFKVISGRIDYMKKMRSGWESGEFDKYTKKERVNIEKEMRRLEELLSGLENLVRLPDVIIIIDPNVHSTAVREARRLKIPTVALVNTDTDVELIDYPVPGNNKARKSIQWFLGEIRKALEAGSLEAKVEKDKKESVNE